MHPLESKIIVMNHREADREDEGCVLTPFKFHRGILRSQINTVLLYDPTDRNCTYLSVQSQNVLLCPTEYEIERLKIQSVRKVYSIASSQAETCGLSLDLEYNEEEYEPGEDVVDWSQWESIEYNSWEEALLQKYGIDLELLDGDNNFESIPREDW